jgi:hypothetical protein
MNCKPGDLAIIVRARYKRNLGAIVRVIDCAETKWLDGKIGPGWSFDGPVLIGTFGFVVNRIEDENLRPLRDSDGQDETLAWAGLPNNKKVNA